jgi:uroporphyrin-III C-methyltransferase/precorrin-2 dehydrogenase/sirohydrochlorin ferrochelatase
MLDLQGRKVVVIGTTEAADRRAEQLARAGASVLRLAGQAAPSLAELMADVPRAGCIARADLAGAALVFIATADADEAACLAATAREARVPVHVLDRPDISDFVMPAIVERGEVVVAVGTGGTAPVLARRIRERIERALPVRLDSLAELFAEFRDRVKRALPDLAARRRFWEQAADGAVADAALAGDNARARELLISALSGRAAPASGHVYLVGAGPGDPDLLTVKALRALQDADVILHDELIGEGILERARHDAVRIHVGKRKDRHSKSQDEINALLALLAREGKRVVRLKGGDPFVFGRGGEELEHLRAQGIDVTVVPGVTAALGCTAAAGFPVTHRGLAANVTFVTGHESAGHAGPDWQALARTGGTLAIYMGASQAGSIARALKAGGLAPATPVAVIADGTRPSERVATGCLAELPILVARMPPKAAILLVVGEVVRLAPAFASGCEALEAAS